MAAWGAPAKSGQLRWCAKSRLTDTKQIHLGCGGCVPVLALVQSFALETVPAESTTTSKLDTDTLGRGKIKNGN